MRHVEALGASGQAVRSAYPPETYRQLARVKESYDPANIFRLNHNIPPSA